MNYLHLWGFLCIKDTGCRGNKITASRVMHFEKMPLNFNNCSLTENQAFDCLICVFNVLFLIFFYLHGSVQTF